MKVRLFTASLLSSLMTLSSLSFAHATPGFPAGLEGTYKLVKARLGMCEDDQARVFSEKLNNEDIGVMVYGYFFPFVNGGTRVNDDYYGRTESTVTFNGSVLKQTLQRKTRGMPKVTTVKQAEFSGGLLKFRITNSDTTPTECWFRRVADEN